MEQKQRPLSPHLQAYRLPLTAIISITHRLTGVLLTIGLIGFTISLGLIQAGSNSFHLMQALLHTPIASAALWLMIYSLFFHLCHGIRHLIWDLGEGYDKLLMNYYLILEMFASIAFTLISFLFIQLGS